MRLAFKFDITVEHLSEQIQSSTINHSNQPTTVIPSAITKLLLAVAMQLGSTSYLLELFEVIYRS